MDPVPEADAYRYTPLAENAFRILTILPADSDTPIACTLENTAWQSDPSQSSAVSYQALSYAWGTGQPDREISLNGRPFFVTTTLEQALHCLRTMEKPRRVWIDAICIDQHNAAEKAVQIRMMDRIFAGAEYVIVWLGEKADGSDVAIKFAKLLSSAVYMWDYSTEGYAYSPVYLRPEANILLCSIFEPAWDAFYRLLNTRPWWYRAWVVQEITVAEAALVLCGNSAISWPDLERAILFSKTHWPRWSRFGLPAWYNDENRHIKIIELITSRGIYFKRTWIDKSMSDLPITYYTRDLLIFNRERQCRFGHDKIYSMLSIAPPAFTESIWIDYTRPVEELFRCVAKIMIERFAVLDIIFYGSHFPWNFNLPSWVPDWGQPAYKIVYDMSQDGIPPSQFQPKTSTDIRRLKVSAARLSVVLDTQIECYVLPGLEKDNSSQDWRGKLVTDVGDKSRDWVFPTQELKALLAPATVRWTPSSLSGYYHSYDRLTVFLKLVGVKISPTSFDPEWYLKTHARKEDESPHPWEEDDWCEFGAELGIGGRTVVLTSVPNLLGLAPDTARPGDVVYWIQGCSALALLRPTNEDHIYHLVGDILIESNKNGKGSWIEVLYEEAASGQGPSFREITLV